MAADSPPPRIKKAVTHSAHPAFLYCTQAKTRCTWLEEACGVKAGFRPVWLLSHFFKFCFEFLFLSALACILLAIWTVYGSVGSPFVNDFAQLSLAHSHCEENSEEREEVSENGSRNGTLFSNETGYDVHAHGVTDTKNKACAQTSRLPIARPWANPRQWVRDLEARVDSRLREKNDWTFTNKLKPPGEAMLIRPLCCRCDARIQGCHSV